MSAVCAENRADAGHGFVEKLREDLFGLERPVTGAERPVERACSAVECDEAEVPRDPLDGVGFVRGFEQASSGRVFADDVGRVRVVAREAGEQRAEELLVAGEAPQAVHEIEAADRGKPARCPAVTRRDEGTALASTSCGAQRPRVA